MGKIYTIREACDILQIDATTLRRWDREGKIHCIRLSNNFRRVPEEEINRILGIKSNRTDAIYARVSSNGQKNDLYNQINRLKSLHPDALVYSDVRSGLKFNRKGFIELLNMIEDNKINNIYITHKDRLARFGFDLIEDICRIHNTRIIEVEGEEIQSANEELTNDLISIITSFSARLYGIRSQKMKNILEAVKE
ncbi:MAG: IS607 family transposase [Ferroplasma sp.]|uniref:IS607 family transposase n=1 Tax=Ferroplasma sp. TaxID=2591003 RepID=UPI0028168D9A|nr:IS607 family transposase [Ferroplasma sp.]WMT50594.1 MAG: IS607 family transposase [Ferroplasma sp.]WMT50704.1 MAG: IS607 family transposase [Ferroplasma sp.]